MRSAQQVIEAIHAARFTGRKVGLENTRALMDRLHIATTVPAIHVAGTNGKGSVCAMVERVLRQAGYATGLYTSPYLQVYNERIRLNGEPIRCWTRRQNWKKRACSPRPLSWGRRWRC